jgi:hypothetical protein
MNASSTTIRHRQVRLGGSSVHVAETGPEEGPACLLGPGLPELLTEGKQEAYSGYFYDLVSAREGIPSAASRAEQAAAYAGPTPSRRGSTGTGPSPPTPSTTRSHRADLGRHQRLRERAPGRPRPLNAVTAAKSAARDGSAAGPDWLVACW